ncbi:hypothetical protein NQ314_007409 [Rhamnusium bicolor]|uniref:Phosphatidylinositol N-acetylglucosaminyltransferase subunit H conserved domain-containing protein n=1 Tax=Rhamnusium bicolor TaxID=1586634 RepID=A0AAV8YP15_9CUCU|nr:hypothetical protein NQ314_007409 [Rhamnusium bicolor]
MVRIKKKEKSANYKTITGENIKLNLEKNEKILKITIFNSSYPSTYRRGVILLVISVLNLLCLILNIFSVKIITGIFITLSIVLYNLYATVKEENLVVVKDLGFQLTTKYLLGVKIIFIPKEQVQKIFINEVIFRHKVIYLLSLLTKEMHINDQLVPLFFDTLPRLACIKLIYKNLKTLEG